MSKNEVPNSSDTPADVPKKHAGGRPCEYKREYCKTARFVTGMGFTDADLAELFGVTVRTIERWKVKYKEFCRALQRGKEIADDEVEKALFKRATGYTHPDTVITNYKGKIRKTAVIKHYPPDTGAAFIWLKNRRPQSWRDKAHVEVSVNSLADVVAIIRGGKNAE